MDRIEAVNYKYNGADEDSRLTSRHGSVEFLTTVRYVEKYLKAGDRILEIGAATGRYSHYFARAGYEVDAVELVEHNIDIFRANTEPGERVRVVQGDALDLSRFDSGTYDIVLLLGPMYHLFTPEDEVQAMSEAIRVTKTGGVVFAAYCTNDSVAFNFGFVRGGFATGEYDHLIDFDTFKLSSTPSELFAMHRKEEIDELMAHFPMTRRLHYVGTDLLTPLKREEVDAMSDELFDLYMKYVFAVCERPDLLGFSFHTLDVFEKTK